MNNKTMSMLTVLFLVIVMLMPLADPLTKLMPFSVYAKEYYSTAQLQNECSSEDGITNCANNNAETIGDENVVISKSHLTLFLRLFHIMKRNRLINEKDIQNALRYAADDLPSLEDRIYKLTNYVMDLESKKSVLKDTITLWNAQLSDLGREIDLKNQQLKRMSK